jgi:hypothetical protein
MEHALQLYVALERLGAGFLAYGSLCLNGLMMWAHAKYFGGSADAADAELEELERKVHGMAVSTTSLQGAKVVHDGVLVRKDTNVVVRRYKRR